MFMRSTNQKRACVAKSKQNIFSNQSEMSALENINKASENVDRNRYSYNLTFPGN